MHEQAVPVYRPIAMFIIAASFYLYEFLLRVAPSVMFPEWTADFQLDANQFGLLSSCYYWSYAALQLPIGALTDRWGPRRLLTFAIVLCSVSTGCFALTQHFYIACLLRCLIGAGSAFAFICCMKIIATWFKPHLFPMMTGLTLTIGTLGAVASAPLSYGLNIASWQTLFYGLSAIGLGMAALAWYYVRDHNPQQIETCQQHSPSMTIWHCLRVIVSQPQNWLIAFYALLVTAPTDAFGGTWGVSFLVHVHHMVRDQSALAVALTFLGLACGSSFIGWLTGRWGSRKKPMALSSALTAMILFVLIYAETLSTLTAALLFFGFGFWGVYVLSFVVVRDLNASQYVATAVGFVNMLSMMGSAILTYVIGALLHWQWQGTTVAGEPIYLASDYRISLLLVPLFYAISACLVVPWIKDNTRLKHHDLT